MKNNKNIFESIYFKNWLFLTESGIISIAPEQVKEMKLFGPVWHGTTEENRKQINQSGFQIFIGKARNDNVRHGYQLIGYGHSDIPPPVHHLGFGIYFTTKRKIAKDYNLGTTKGMEEFYLHVPRLEIINWGSTNTMMKWWQKHGYDMPTLSSLRKYSQDEIEKIHIEATKKLTNNLKSQFDAVWYKGKGLYSLLDGDQICIFNTSNIYRIDNNLSQGYDIGQGKIVKPGDRIQIKDVYEFAKIIDVKPVENNDFFVELWNDALGSFLYQFTVSITPKVKNKIQEIWWPKLYKSAMKQKDTKLWDSWKEKLETDEAIANHFVRYALEHSLIRRFPSSLVEKVLKPKERIKRL